MHSTCIKIILNLCACILALVTGHSIRMRSIMLSSVPHAGLPYISILSHNRHEFREERWEGGSYGIYNVCFDFLYNFCQVLLKLEFTLLIF